MCVGVRLHKVLSDHEYLHFGVYGDNAATSWQSLEILIRLLNTFPVFRYILICSYIFQIHFDMYFRYILMYIYAYIYIQIYCNFSHTM